MIIDLHLDGAGARGSKESAEATGATLRAVQAGSIDPAATRVVEDWVQYKNNFRTPVARRPVLRGVGNEFELAFDLRRTDPAHLDEEIQSVLDRPEEGFEFLEGWVPTAQSVIWRFNALYWGELALWQEVSGHEYAQALPGGESAATKSESARAVILELFKVFDHLVERHALPERLNVLEIGVGNGDQAKVWLDEFRRIDAEQGRDYYRRLQYLMGDYSGHVLGLARNTVAEHKAHVSTLVLDASRPLETLRFLEGSVFFVYISNVYDNLATDELACLSDELYQVEVRAYLPSDEVAQIAASLGVEPRFVQGFASRLVALGPRLLAETLAANFPDGHAATIFWQQVWSALRLSERYRPLGPLDRYSICEGLTGELLAPMLAGQGDVRFHVSNGAVASFLDTLPLLHPYGVLTCIDLFVTDFEQYHRAFRGPGKYDGSVVNWVNGPILQASASRRGYQVTFTPFAHGSRSPISTAVAVGAGLRATMDSSTAERPVRVPLVQIPDRPNEATILQTSVVGSYSVPEWLGRFKTDFHLGRVSPELLGEVNEMAIKAALVDQQHAGVDVVSDGEFRRDNDMDYFVERLPGTVLLGKPKSYYFDYLEVALRTRLPEAAAFGGFGLVEDFGFIGALTQKPVTISMPGPFSLSRRLQNEAYDEPGALVMALGALLGREAKALERAGVTRLQIDEPFLAGYPEAIELAVAAINCLTEGLSLKVALHVCYGNRYARPAWEGHYDFLFPYVLDAHVDSLVLEFARKGLEDLELFRRYPNHFIVGCGVIDVKTNEIETAEVVAGRLRQALKILPAEQLMVNPDCGLRHLPSAVARQKLAAMVEGARLVRAELRGEARAELGETSKASGAETGADKLASGQW